MANKFAVITGASTGIGFEIAKKLSQDGYDIMIIAEEETIHEAAQSLTHAGSQVLAVKENLARTEGVQAAFEAIKQFGKPVDILVLNAGVGVNGDFVRDNLLEDELNLIGLNITSVVHLSKLVLPEMVSRGEGRVLITSSIAALMPGPYYATYAASKSFLLSFSEALYNELKETGVTVTCLMPGPTDTEFFMRAGMEDTKAAQGDKDDPSDVAADAIEALMAGKDHIIAGSIKNKFQGFMSRFMSEQMLANMHAAQAKPGSAEH